ncbi:universal stress protein [Nocardioides yefusunii]|uniref:Universal stress protein n=1 Tax=Nocardioides yefusunii TaxID=2500546 RepID=A0ABW1QX19_9ACTN|nr:universal stress protein [Nocardioides yefusunii]
MATSILVGVDDSETARSAALTAAGLAQALQAELHVVSAFGKFEAERYNVGGDEYLVSNHDDAVASAERVANIVRVDFPDLTLHVSAADGKPAEALVRVAEEIDATVVVVGNKRVQGLVRMLGSIASDVAKNAPCDVFIAHTH